jgi:hypothetical protein
MLPLSAGRPLLPECGGTIFLENIGTHPADYTVSEEHNVDPVKSQRLGG